MDALKTISEAGIWNEPVLQVGNRMNTTGKGTFRQDPSRINRKGRPKKDTSIAEIIRYELNQQKKVIIGGEESTVFVRHNVIRKLISLAEDGDIQAIKYLVDRVEGPVTQKMELSGTVDLQSRAAAILEAAKNDTD